MKKINIYSYVTVKGPGKKDGSFTYLLEFETAKGNATLTKQGEVKEASETRANLQILIEALGRIKERCEVTIYTDYTGLKIAVEEWLQEWKKNQWKNAKGKEIANKEEWQKIAYLLGEHQIIIKSNEAHSYREWIKTETEKKEKERKCVCLKNSESSTQQRN